LIRSRPQPHAAVQTPRTVVTATTAKRLRPGPGARLRTGAPARLRRNVGGQPSPERGAKVGGKNREAGARSFVNGIGPPSVPRPEKRGKQAHPDARVCPKRGDCRGTRNQVSSRLHAVRGVRTIRKFRAKWRIQ
jgi:hypothetical protein